MEVEGGKKKKKKKKKKEKKPKEKKEKKQKDKKKKHKGKKGKHTADGNHDDGNGHGNGHGKAPKHKHKRTPSGVVFGADFNDKFIQFYEINAPHAVEQARGLLVGANCVRGCMDNRPRDLKFCCVHTDCL